MNLTDAHLNVTIRPAILQDAPEIHRVHMRSIQQLCARDYAPEQIEAWGNRPYVESHRISNILQDHVWVAESAGNVEGFCRFKFISADNSDFGVVMGLYLTPEIQGKGIGRRLLESALSKAAENRIVRVELASTLTSRAFYEKMGFREVSRAKGHVFRGVFIPSVPMEIGLRNAPLNSRLSSLPSNTRKAIFKRWRSCLNQNAFR